MSSSGGGVRLSVIIVTWNVRDLVIACIESVQREVSGIPFEIIVVDNASSDGTAPELRRRFPGIVVIANPENVGFPVANNQALRHARGEYVLFLNPDTEVGPGSVVACMAALDADAAVGMAGCRLVLEDGRTQLECARRPYLLRHLVMELPYLHMLFPRSRIFGDHLMGYWDHSGERDVEAICGAFMLARRVAAEQVGGLPDEIFMYHEDLAFCLRMRRAGWRIRYLGDYSTLHRWRGSSSRSEAKLALLEGQYKLQLIHDAQGPLFAAVGRVIFGLRCATRLLAALIGSALFGRTRMAARYVRALDWRTHGLQLVWTVLPGAVAHLVPKAPAARTHGGRPAVALQGTAAEGGACPPQ